MADTDNLVSRRVPVADLRVYPRNPRVGDTAAIGRSLREFGQYRPIVVNSRTGHILAGNHTYLAAVDLGWEEISASFIDVDEETAQRIVLADNRLADIGRYDDSLLTDLLSEVAAISPDAMATLGYSQGDLDKLLAKTAPPADFATYDSAIPTEYRCPKCAYEWSGAPS